MWEEDWTIEGGEVNELTALHHHADQIRDCRAPLWWPCRIDDRYQPEDHHRPECVAAGVAEGGAESAAAEVNG